MKPSQWFKVSETPLPKPDRLTSPPRGSRTATILCRLRDGTSFIGWMEYRSFSDPRTSPTLVSGYDNPIYPNVKSVMKWRWANAKDTRLGIEIKRD